MVATLYREDVHSLSQQLQSLFRDIPVAVRCVFKDGRLLVLGQHQPGVAFDSWQLLHLLETTIQTIHRGGPRQVRLYLCVTGQTHPYAQHHFVTRPPVPPPNPNLYGTERPAFQETWIPEDEELGSLIHELGLPAFRPAAKPPSNPTNTAAKSLVRLPISLQIPSLSWPQAWPKEWPKASRQQALTLGVTAIGLAGGAYGLSQPCVVGTCPQMATAQELGQQTEQIVATAQTPQDLEAARQSLKQATTLLETIPLWSPRHSPAQTLRQDYQTQITTLEQASTATSTANQALQKLQASAPTLSEWQELRSLWQQSIQQLEAIADQEPVSSFAQRRLASYRTYLSLVEEQLRLEKAAQRHLAQAREAARLAEVRRQKAQSLADWQQVRATWRAAIDRLGQISPDRGALAEAQELSALYQTELTRTLARVNQEKLAAQLFSQANQQVLKAQEAEQSANWSQATTAWGQAIQAIQQVPSGTSYQLQAESLTSAYSKAQAQAQQQLQVVQQIQTEVGKACTGQLRICNALSVDKAIKIQLDSAYVQAIESAKASGNHDLQAIVADHQLTLRQSLEQLASRFRMPVEVYDTANSLLDRHLPQ